ncbi:MAG: hypothetical protein COS90_10945 [Deltaproteobacteria bacterium CG07_land_8_20_14_0_80_60_11]|nr:MAG: hypothetical protein COS90_10945 [Deltaproteobacteria bacterium CG07_land_8_20_14_0_80_60_11]
MIEAGITLLRLLLGLGALFFLGYAWLTLLIPRPRDFSGLERAAFSFGAGVLVLTLWMLALTLGGVPFGLEWILGPPLALAAALLLAPRGRRAVREDWRACQVRPRIAFNGWDWLFLGLLGIVFLYALPRAALYPIWAWDAVATWGCKARIFYASRGLDLTCIDAHNYYPNLIPLLLSYLYFALGQVNDSLAKVIFPLWGALLLGLLYSLAARLGLSRRSALGLTAFLALNGAVFIVHLYIAYADLPLAFFTLGGAGLIYLWLAGAAPRGSLTLSACCLAGMAWCKYEGPPLAATLILAAALTLAWLRPARWVRRLGQLSVPLAGLVAGYLPWRLFAMQQKIEIGADHIQGFYPHQMVQAIYYLLAGLAEPYYFGFLWPALALALILAGNRLWRSPRLFLALFVGGNLLAIILAYAVAPTGAAEFPAYVRATLDRLLLHLTPVAALLLALGLKDVDSALANRNLPGNHPLPVSKAEP